MVVGFQVGSVAPIGQKFHNLAETGSRVGAKAEDEGNNSNDGLHLVGGARTAIRS